MGLCASLQVPMRYPLLVIAFSLRNPVSCDVGYLSILYLYSGVEFDEVVFVFFHVLKPLLVVGANGVVRVIGIVSAVDYGEGIAER